MNYLEGDSNKINSWKQVTPDSNLNPYKKTKSTGVGNYVIIKNNINKYFS